MGETSRIYHVAKNGCDENSGAKNAPFLTISAAVKVARAGDTVLVHAGEYREWVAPEYGDVIFLSAEEGKAVIKGSELWNEWKALSDGIFYADIPNGFFGENNPFAEEICGDWFDPCGRKHHTGAVYFRETRLCEAKDKESLKREKNAWYAEVSPTHTSVWASFSETPEVGSVEINVRKYCFFPRKTGVDRITVKGFRICHAATNWAPPTALQEGAIGPHWSYGWVIENNIIHDSRCVGISLGKEKESGHNPATLIKEKPGFNYELECVFKALRLGWRKGKVGSHLVKNNTVYDCGQAGIVGHMGCAFSKIIGNHVYRIHAKESFAGPEIACIKFHAAIDVLIEGNRLHDCARFGIWLDWQDQGARMTRNLFYHNGIDLFIEVSHGPCLVDNNLFLSENSAQLMAQGTAFAHNLFLGRISSSDVLARATPYHFPHETDVMGTENVYGGDDRFYNNIFYGPFGARCEGISAEKEKIDEAMGDESSSGDNYGLLDFRVYPLGYEAYKALMQGKKPGLLATFRDTKQPVYIEGNAYSLGANEIRGEKGAVLCPDFDLSPKFEETEEGLYLTFCCNDAFYNAKGTPVTTARLGKPRFPEAPYENADGTPLRVDTDFFGNARENDVRVGPFENVSKGINRIKIG